MAYKIRRTMGGIKIQTSSTGKLSFFGATPVVKPTAAAQGALTAATGTADGTIVDVTASFDQGKLNDNFQECASRINALRTALVNLGLITGS